MKARAARKHDVIIVGGGLPARSALYLLKAGVTPIVQAPVHACPPGAGSRRFRKGCMNSGKTARVAIDNSHRNISFSAQKGLSYVGGLCDFGGANERCEVLADAGLFQNASASALGGLSTGKRRRPITPQFQERTL
jgi:hypothetical protein